MEVVSVNHTSDISSRKC